MEHTVRAAVSLEIKSSKALFFHALTFFGSLYVSAMLVACFRWKFIVFGQDMIIFYRSDQVFVHCACSVLKMMDKGNLVILEI